MWCDFSTAKRITSAVEPSCVVTDAEAWSSEISPSRHGGGWIVAVFLNGKLDHSRAFECLDAAHEYAEMYND